MMAVCLSCQVVEAIDDEASLDRVDCGCPAPRMGIIEGDDIVNLPGARASAADTLAARHQAQVVASSSPPPPAPPSWSWQDWADQQAARRLDSRADHRSS